MAGGATAGAISPALPAISRLQRCSCGGGCPACQAERSADDEHAEIQREASGVGPGVAPPIVHHVLASPGRPLEAQARAFMEPRFGADFGGVRVHTDARAAESARAVNAVAYTVGRDVVFAEGRYQPATAEGRRLLAHELAHVLQQRDGLARQTPPTGQQAQPQCGPNVTAWFAQELYLWAVYAQNLESLLATQAASRGTPMKAEEYAAMLVVGPQMTYEPTTTFTSAAAGACPAEQCDGSVTLCNRCMHRSELGNFLYAYFARSLRMTWLQTYGGSLAGNRGTRSEADIQSVRLGYDYRDTPNSDLCTWLGDTSSRWQYMSNAERW
ncbi:MAG TPA: DUF4157 domain-containing protein, partial [Longimicrobium sp.]